MKGLSGTAGGISASTVIICLILIAVCVLAVKGYCKRLSSGCCGAGSDKVKKVSVRDTRKKHYPYEAYMKINGMTCENCARCVENGLNSLEGVWARVDFGKGTARCV